ncbi:MAG: helix-turn-helix transcriptional regulator [Bacteroidetes bacterium]|jgi:DNA-binding CsgD family transcriptional regulator|nr:helix-turn-helix transcriptional regulator [Bacteroidota bacterium]
MSASSRILLVTPNRLVGIGLKKLLLEYFSPLDVSIVADLGDVPELRSFDVAFLSSDSYVLYRDRFAAISTTPVILTEGAGVSESREVPLTVNVTGTESEIVEQVQRGLSAHRPGRGHSKAEHLSAREVGVLRLVARGYLNKQIADKLSISLHTVISHRKNITRKLGIKTVSGLTIYALLNGLVSSKDVG